MNVVSAILILVLPALQRQAPELTVQLVGNAGVVLTDGTTSLLIDLPYESGAFGYERYDPSSLTPGGNVFAVITHAHADHFDRNLFVGRAGWRIIGPPSATANLPPERVAPDDSITLGAFAVVPVRTPHTDDHRSYRIRWRGRVLFFTGDTEDASAILQQPRLDVLFVTPWLNCAVARSARPTVWARAVLYHRRPDGSDPKCGSAEILAQGARFTILPRST